jgi:subtilase family serine protease
MAVFLSLAGYAEAAPHAAVCRAEGAGSSRCHVRVVVDSSGLPVAGPTPTGYTPSQIRHAYGLDLIPNDGTGTTIAIIGAYDNPNAERDLNTFSAQFGLPPCTTENGCFTKATPQGAPGPDQRWALEGSMDVQWAHAIAPGAKIILVEAKSGTNSNLYAAVDYAAKHANVVSMSWGGNETSNETSLDKHFANPAVLFTTSAGDTGTAASYPSASPCVVAVGGTTLTLDSSNNVTSETAWSGSGGGISAYEAVPAYQNNFPIPSTGGKRGIPDVAFDADPNTGVPVYDSLGFNNGAGWFRAGGTSFGAPAWAAILALARQSRTTPLPKDALFAAAAKAVYSTNYRDITSGTNGTCGVVCTASTGYDFVTGLGSPIGNKLVPYLATH